MTARRGLPRPRSPRTPVRRYRGAAAAQPRRRGLAARRAWRSGLRVPRPAAASSHGPQGDDRSHAPALPSSAPSCRHAGRPSSTPRLNRASGPSTRAASMSSSPRPTQRRGTPGPLNNVEGVGAHRLYSHRAGLSPKLERQWNAPNEHRSHRDVAAAPDVGTS